MDKLNGHCRYSSKKKKEDLLESAIPHTVDAIKSIVKCSKDESFRKRCFAALQVEELDDFSGALSSKLWTIATRRFGGLRDSVQGKELNVSYSDKNMKAQVNRNFDDFELAEGGCLYKYAASMISEDKVSPTSQLALVKELPFQECGTCENPDSQFDLFGDICWNLSEADSLVSTFQQNETTGDLIVKDDNVLAQQGGQLPKQAMLLAPKSTGMDKQLLKVTEVKSKQTNFEKEIKESENTQECETLDNAQHKLYHLSKSSTENKDDWLKEFGQDDFWANLSDCHSPLHGCLQANKMAPTNDTKSSESNTEQSRCYIAAEYPTTDTVMFHSQTKESRNQSRREDQCVPSENTISVTDQLQLSVGNIIDDDFDSLAGFF